MPRFDRHEGIAVPLPVANLDTDQILPGRFLKKPRSDGYHRYLFHDLARDAKGRARRDFPLARPAFAGADILVSGANFGCGSSREGAVYALVDAGFRAVIAESFGDIFRNNALKNGLLPVALPARAVAALLAALEAAPGARVAIDLSAQTVALPGGCTATFEIDPFRKDLLMKGVDELDLTLSMAATIGAFEASHAAARPWVLPAAGDGPR